MVSSSIELLSVCLSCVYSVICLKACLSKLSVFAKSAVGETLDEVREKAGVDMGNVQKWLRANKLSLNTGKTKCVLIGSRHKTKHADIGIRGGGAGRAAAPLV